jgi:hypothetical protein
MHMVGEAATVLAAIAADHRRSAAGETIPPEVAVGIHAYPARAVGPAAAAAADGAVAASAVVEEVSAAAVGSVAERQGYGTSDLMG